MKIRFLGTPKETIHFLKLESGQEREFLGGEACSLRSATISQYGKDCYDLVFDDGEVAIEVSTDLFGFEIESLEDRPEIT